LGIGLGDGFLRDRRHFLPLRIVELVYGTKLRFNVGSQHGFAVANAVFCYLGSQSE
jgi:hypothetical protein